MPNLDDKNHIGFDTIGRVKRGVFITMEGTDGAGKSTHARLLAAHLTKRGRRVLLTREPGGGKISEKIRALLLDPKIKMSEKAELFLYQAARAEHVEKIIRPALKRGRVIICDRFTDATLAYQGFARGLSKKLIRRLNDLATDGLKPRLTLWLDIDPRIGLKKAHALKGEKDRLEKEGVRFQALVRKGYASMHRADPRRFKRISVKRSIDETQALIRRAVERVA